MKLSTSQVKSLMRSGLRLLVDPQPEPKERKRVKDFFQHSCAYCGSVVEDGKGDLDHLLPASRGGRNHISNRVFSCALCNQKEKGDKDWQVFLLEKYGHGAEFEKRERKILDWLESVEILPHIPASILQIIEAESQRVTADYDIACQRIRRLR